MTSSPEPQADAPLPSASSAKESGPEPERNEPSPSSSDLVSGAGFSGGMLRGIAGLALVAMIVARGLAPALPGSVGGIARWIRLSETASMLLSQLLVVSGALVVFRLIVRTLRHNELGVVYRLVAVPFSAGALTIIMAASQAPERAGTALGLAVVTSAVAIAATFAMLAAPRTRAAGFVLGVVGTASFVHVLSRVLAIRASEQALASLFTMAQGVATLSFALDVTSMALVAVWLSARSWKRATPVGVVLVCVSVLLAWGAVRGSSYDAPTWQVIASRSLATLTRHPSPMVMAILRYSVEVLAFLTAATVLVVRRRDSTMQAVFALALLTRTSTDIPLCALCLVIAALLGPLASLEREGDAAPATDRSAKKPVTGSAGSS